MEVNNVLKGVRELGKVEGMLMEGIAREMNYTKDMEGIIIDEKR